MRILEKVLFVTFAVTAAVTLTLVIVAYVVRVLTLK